MSAVSIAQSDPTDIRDFAVELAATGVPSGLIVRQVPGITWLVTYRADAAALKLW